MKLVFSLLVFPIVFLAQNKSNINYKNQILNFIPKGYQILDSVKGNLNNDNYADYIIVLKKNNEEELSKISKDELIKRPLLILVGNLENKLVLKRRNDNTVFSVDYAGAIHGDCFVGIKIKNGYFSVEHYTVGGFDKWSKIVTYKYDKLKNNWFLHRVGTEFFKLNSDDNPNAEVIVKTGETFLTKKNFGIVPFEKYNIYK